MKVQELLHGAKPSPSPRAGRSAGLEGKSSDFAGALTEARRKPEPKPPETQAPRAKKPAAAAKKSKGADDDSAPADDAVASDAAAAEKAGSQRPVDETEPVASDDDGTAADVEESERPSVSEEVEADANPTALTVAQTASPQSSAATVEAVPEDGMDAACDPPRAASAMSNADHPAAQAPLDGGDGDAELPQPAAVSGAAATAPASEGAAATVPASARAVHEVPPDQADAAPPAKAPVAPAKLQAAGEAATTADSEAPNASHQQLSEVASEPTVNVEGQTTASHVQPEGVKPHAAPAASAAPAPTPAPVTPQAHFAETNHPKIVTAVQTQALTNGGSMQIRLDPPELGALQVLVHMQDGVMTASFQTSNDDATRLLSHSLSQLKQVLESQGVSVEKLQVQQAPKDQQAGNQGEDRQHQRDQHDDAHRQEQQRKEMLRRMWRRLANGSDPLDLVA